jgi:cellulose synthase/poly-beta-1,6-N-acetylglucosamine synthase-like glycosyltransferase
VVPAHNEEDLLPRCLRSLRPAVRQLNRRGHHCRVVLVADSCSDATVGRARALVGRWGQVIEVSVGNVGLARALGVRHGLGLVGEASPERMWLANTDADSAVPPGWLRRQLAWAERGMSGVAGIVRVDSFGEHPAGLAERFARHYPVGPRRHQHVHGANLGVRMDAYRAVAGWPDVALAEDHRLWDRLVSGGWPVVADSGLWVTTSGRRVGRAEGGFADTLAAYAADDTTGDVGATATPAGAVAAPVQGGRRGDAS